MQQYCTCRCTDELNSQHRTAVGRAEAADLFGSNVLDQYGIAASAEFTDMRALDISY